MFARAGPGQRAPRHLPVPLTTYRSWLGCRWSGGGSGPPIWTGARPEKEGRVSEGLYVCCAVCFWRFVSPPLWIVIRLLPPVGNSAHAGVCCLLISRPRMVLLISVEHLALLLVVFDASD